MPSVDDNHEQATYESYLSHRNALIDAEHKQSFLFDRSAITLSGGALALSLAFIKDTAGQAPKATWLLVLAWSALIIALMSTLSSFQFSVRAHEHERKILDARYLGQAIKTENIWSKWVTRANLASLLLIVLGVSCLAVFVTINLRS
jgi:hypothetical protein